MYSIIEQGGMQFKVSAGDIIRVPLIEAEKGTELTVEKVLLAGEGADVKVGTPVLSGVSVTAKILDHCKDDKVVIVKHKRRKDYRRKNGHRQSYTKLEIVSINA